MKIYAFSGLGADKRVFNFLELNHELTPIDWIEPMKNEPVKQYAKRISEKINTKEDYGILGLSFGGLVAIEVSKIVKPKFTILISTIETRKELSYSYKIIGATGIIRILPVRIFNPPRKLANFLFGTSKHKLLNQILNDTDFKFVKWALNELLTWNNKDLLDNVIRLHGKRDYLLSSIKSGNVIWVKDGAHLMIVDEAKNISSIINETLKGIL